jgi:hypothetical protein
MGGLEMSLSRGERRSAANSAANTPRKQLFFENRAFDMPQNCGI